jgi:hypothetical protein
VTFGVHHFHQSNHFVTSNDDDDDDDDDGGDDDSEMRSCNVMLRSRKLEIVEMRTSAGSFKESRSGCLLTW